MGQAEYIQLKNMHGLLNISFDQTAMMLPFFVEKWRRAIDRPSLQSAGAMKIAQSRMGGWLGTMAYTSDFTTANTLKTLASLAKRI